MRFIKHLFLSITAFTVLTSLTNLNTTTVKAGTNELSTIPVIALGNSLKNKDNKLSKSLLNLYMELIIKKLIFLVKT